MQGAEPTALILQHLTTSDGLAQGSVMTTLQDTQGFVWLGTEEGLIRFDGYELLRYASSPDIRGGLPGNFIYQIVEDAHHDLWVAVKDAGIARWHRETDEFTVYRHDPRNLASLASDSVHTLLIDSQGHIWIGTSDQGIDILDPASGRVEHLRHRGDDPGSLRNDRILTLAAGRGGTVWVGTESGLDLWLPQRRAFAHLEADANSPDGLGTAQITSLLEDASGSVWVGTLDSGLKRIDRAGRVLQSFRHDSRSAESLSSDHVRAILEDRAGRLWVGTAEGLDLLEGTRGQFSHYRHDKSDPESLRDSFIMSLYQDQSGLLWIGTRTGGVSRWDPRSWELGGRRPEWLGSRLVTAFADAPGGKVWIGTLGGGLSQLDLQSGKVVPLQSFVSTHNVLGDDRVMSLLEDHRGSLWIGTMSKGLSKLTPDGHLETIPIKAGDPHALSAAGIMSMLEARNGHIWVGTFGGGVNVLDAATGRVRQLPYGSSEAGAVSGPNVSALAEDPDGNLWIGTDGSGLNLARADGTVVGSYHSRPGDPGSLPSNTVYAVMVDAHRRVWIATTGGLARVVGSTASPESIRFDWLTQKQGLSSNTLYGILSDASGRLWLSGSAGLMRVDPETGSVKTFHREDGLQGEEFDFGAYHRLRDGRLCFGGPGGFNIFDPARLSENRRPPRVVLTHLEVLGVPLPSRTPYWQLERIALDHRASIVSLDFGVLDFTSPKYNRLSYRIAGLADRWIDVGAQHRITLTNLDSGDHLLEVRSANSDSAWSGLPLRLTLHRDPLPWKSPWAYAAYTTAVLLTVLWCVRLHRLKLQRMVSEGRRLEREVEQRTHELLESNRQLAEAAKAKSSFLDRMSHELRTPMNGVVGMTELLARTGLSPTQARLTQTIRSSAQVLLQIVNDLLDLSKVQAGKVALEELPIDLCKIMEECASLFGGAADSKGIALIACPLVEQPGRLLGDPLRIRQILMNLIGNAVKFTEAGEIVVRANIVRLESDRATVDFVVTDTGIGMDAATVAKIFEPFTQADESTTRRFGGSGLGLAICRELAELMGGTVRVESRLRVGSTFHVSLPLVVADPLPMVHARTLQSAHVSILTRRPALAESLSRYAQALGLTVSIDSQLDVNSRGREQIVITDASGYREYARQSGIAEPHRGVVVVTTTTELDSEDLKPLAASGRIVLMPVQRDALYEAVASALGAPTVPSTASITFPPGDVPAGHVLLVEDEPVNAEVAQGYLSFLGCTCVWVKDGAEAVARHAAERFDLILMDLSMPGMDGFATTALIRQRDGTRQPIPIVALTAHDANSYREKCLLAGIDDLLTKPYTLKDCAQVLRRWLNAPATKSVVGPIRAGLASEAADPQPTRPTTVEPASSLDEAAVARLQALRPGLYPKLVELFQASSTEGLAQLRTALERSDWQAARALAHKLKSAAANVGALVYASQVRQLEAVCAEGDACGARELHSRLETAHPALIEELTCQRLRASA